MMPGHHFKFFLHFVSSWTCAKYQGRKSMFKLGGDNIGEKYTQGRPQDLGGGGGNKLFFQIWEFACRKATCCAWRSHAHC